MRPTDPLTDLYRRTVVQLARRVIARNARHYRHAPLGYVAIQVLEFCRLCEENGIVDAALLERMVDAVFTPSPAAFAGKDIEYIGYLIAGTDSGPEAKTLSVEKYCSSRAR